MRRFRSILSTLLIGFIATQSLAQRPSRAEAEAVQAGTNLPVLSIDAKEPIVSERKVPCGAQLILPPPATGDTEALPGVVRIRGATSQAYEKKSYGLTLDAPTQWLGLRNSVHWIANAAFVDRSLMRHKLSYDLFRSLSSADAPRYAVASRFVEVKLFDRLHGDPAYRQGFAARWKQLRAREFSVAAIDRMIDENARELGDAAQRNAARWPTLDGPYPDRLTFQQDLAQMKEWVVARVRWLDAEIARRADSRGRAG